MAKSITRRWVRGNLLLTAIILLLAQLLFSFFTVRSYYDNTTQALRSRLDNIAGQLSVASNMSPDQRSVALHNMVEEFTESAKFELMLVNHSGEVVAYSGTVAGSRGDMPDINEALNSASGTGSFTGLSEQGEPIMALSELVPYSTADVAAIRIVVSLTLVNGAIINAIGASLIVVTAVFLFSLFTGLYFVRSIVTPISRVEHSAAKIAQGDFNVRIENNYNDEVGRLCDTINHMAVNLSETQRLKNEFISSVSHELRTPLTSIKGWVETLGKFHDLKGDSAKKALRIIGSEAERLSQMVEELLDFSRMQDSGIKLNKDLIDLVAELADAVHIAEGRAVTEQVAIIFDEPQDIIAVMADKNRLRQVFLNILDNALKYTPAGGCVYVTCDIKTGWVYVNVRDEGPGIPEEDLPHIKEKFYKAKNSKAGNGIGLAVAEEIMNAHGGTITLSSPNEGGLTVTVQMRLKGV